MTTEQIKDEMIETLQHQIKLLEDIIELKNEIIELHERGFK